MKELERNTWLWFKATSIIKRRDFPIELRLSGICSVCQRILKVANVQICVVNVNTKMNELIGSVVSFLARRSHKCIIERLKGMFLNELIL